MTIKDTFNDKMFDIFYKNGIESTKCVGLESAIDDIWYYLTEETGAIDPNWRVNDL